MLDTLGGSGSVSVDMMLPSACVEVLIDLSWTVLGFPLRERYNISITVIISKDGVHNKLVYNTCSSNDDTRATQCSMHALQTYQVLIGLIA